MSFEYEKKQLRLWILKKWHIYKSRFKAGTIRGEENELAGLYRNALGLWKDKNPFYYDTVNTHKAFLEDFEYFFVQLEDNKKINTSLELKEILKACYLDFLNKEPTFIKEPDKPKSFFSSSLQQQQKDRSKLEGYIQHNENFVHYAPAWQFYIFTMFEEVISHLELPETTTEPSSILLQSELLQLSSKQGKIIEYCFTLMESEEVERDYFYRGVLWRLTNNFNTTLGIAHHKATRLKFHEYFLEEPTSQRAQVLLAGTPFETLLLSALPLPVSDHYRYSHTHILGGIGAGKTQLLQQLILADLSRPVDQIPSMVIIDSQGDMLEKIKRLKLFERSNLSERLLIIDPTDLECPPQLNLFDYPTKSNNPKIQERDFNALLEMFDFVFSGLLGAVLSPRQKLLFRYLAELMSVIPNATILTFKDVLECPEDFVDYMKQTKPVTRDFLLNQFLPPPQSRTGGKYSVTRDAILSRLYLLIQNNAFLRMFGATKNKLDLYKALQEDGKIILVHTDKDFLQPSVSAMFGRYIIASVFKAALERAPLDEDKRRPTFLYVDEASEYFDSSMKNLIVQARKYKIGLVFAHQSLSQIKQEADKSLESVVHGNTSIKIIAGVDINDAKMMAANMRTSPEYIMDMKVEKDVGSDFAIFVKNMTPQAMRYRVNFGVMENAPQISQQDYDFNILRSQLAFGCQDGKDSKEPDQNTSSQPSSPSVPQDITDDEVDNWDVNKGKHDPSKGWSESL